MFKKFLSLLLAVTMIFSVVAVSAFASADTVAPSTIGLVVKSDAVVGQSSGVVTLEIYYEFPDGFDNSDYFHNASNVQLAWNSSKYSLRESDWSWHFTDSEGNAIFQSGKFSHASTVWNNLSKKLATYGEDGMGWDDTAIFQQSYDANGANYGTEYGAKMGYSVNINGVNLVHALTVKFDVVGTLTADDILGIPVSSVAGTGKTTMTYYTTKKVSYADDAIDLTKALPAPTKVANKAVQIKDNGNGTYALGFVGTFVKAAIDPAFDAVTNISANLESVGVTIAVEGAADPITATTDTVYDDTDNSGYKFRAILDGLDVANYGDKKITVTMFVKVKGETTPICAGEVVTTLNDQLARVGW